MFSVFEHLHKSPYSANNAEDNEEPGQVTSPSRIFVVSAIKSRRTSSLQYVLMNLLVDLLVPHVVEMRHFLALALLAWSVATLLSIAVRPSLLTLGVWVVMGVLGPFGAMSSIASAVVETRRRAAKRASLLVQASGGP